MSTRILPLSTAPFPPNESATSTFSAVYDRLLGNLYADENFVYQLVELDDSDGAAVAKKALKWSTRASHTVSLGSALTDDAAGVGPASMDEDVAHQSYFLMIVGGRATVKHGDDSTNTLTAARPFAIIDDDADTGKIRGVAAPKSGEKVLGKYISGTAADDADMVIELSVDDVPRQTTVLAVVADGSALTNSTSETTLGSVTIHGSALKAGDVLHVVSRVHVSATNSTDTLNLKLYLGTEEIVATGAVDVADNDIGYIEAFITIRTTGASATISASGTAALGVAGTAAAEPFRKDQATEDLSAATAIAVKGTWSVASASNSCVLEDLLVIHHPAATAN